MRHRALFVFAGVGLALLLAGCVMPGYSPYGAPAGYYPQQAYAPRVQSPPVAVARPSSLARSIGGGAGNDSVNLTLTCGQDGTTALQNALNTMPVVTPTSCPDSNPIFISQTVTIPSFTSLVCTGGNSWIKLANQGPAAPMIANANVEQSGTGTVLDQSIEVKNCNFDGNSANQALSLGAKGLYFRGVSGITLENLDVINTVSDAIQVDGNGAHTAAGFIDKIKVSGVEQTQAGVGFGLALDYAQRDMFVSNVFVQNSGNTGIFIDASEGNYTNISAQGSGAGSTCTNSGSNTVDNPANGGAAQADWVPCAPGIYARNVTNITGANWAATDNNYYGIVMVGAKHVSVSGITAAYNSLFKPGVWNDLHLDANPLLGGYGEDAYVSLAGIDVGANTQNLDQQSLTVSPPTENYGLYVSPALPGSCADATIANPGTGYAKNDTVSLAPTGASTTENCVFRVNSVSGGAVTEISRVGTNGFGQFTELPANPVATSGGSGSGLSLNIEWSSGNITGVTCAQTVSGCVSEPAFREYWAVDAVGVGAPPVVDACAATITGADTISPAGCGTVSAGVYSPPEWVTPNTAATFEVLSGGGGGGYCDKTGQSGAGGGGGGLAMLTGPGLIQPGGTYSFIVGAGGSGGNASAPQAGAGGPSSIGLIGASPRASGGGGGAACSAATQMTSGGVGQGGTTNLTGGTGTNAAGITSAGGGVPLGLGEPGQLFGSGLGEAGVGGVGFGSAGSGALATGGAGGAGQPGLISVTLRGQ